MKTTNSMYWQRLRQALANAKINMSALARRSAELSGKKITPQSVQYLCDPKNNANGSENSIFFAQVTGVDLSWLVTGKGEMIVKKPLLALVEPAIKTGLKQIPLRGRVPIISLVAAGTWREAVNNFAVSPDDYEWTETTAQVSQHAYALRVEGDSMEPRFPNGAILIVDPAKEAKNGSFVIVRQNGEDVTFKQLVIDGGNYLLKPLNPRYPIMEMRKDAVICGVVKKMEMEVE